jgi:hypothetical protein
MMELQSLQLRHTSQTVDEFRADSDTFQIQSDDVDTTEEEREQMRLV